MEKNNLNNINSDAETKEERNIETKVVLEKRKPSFFMSLIIFLLGALITAVIFLICFGNKIIPKAEVPPVEQETEQVQPTEVIKEVPKLNLNIEGDLVAVLENKLTFFGKRWVPLLFDGTTHSYSTLSDNDKVLFALMNSESSYVPLLSVSSKLDNRMSLYTHDTMSGMEAEKIDLKEVSKKYKSLYGADKEIPLIDAVYVAYVYEYVAEDNCYYGHEFPGGGGSDLSYSYKVTDCQANEDYTEIYLYTSFLAINRNGDYWTLAKDYKLNNVVKSDVTTSVTDNKLLYDGVSLEELFNTYLESNPGKYKHTFKLDTAGNYYWHSTEFIQE